tara:strand:+ start:141 stop:353 length:213 start_codon:yes stop_codon:yes gene_type:complete
VDEEFIIQNAIPEDWYQLSFNEKFNWNFDFLINNLDNIGSNYALSKNKRLFDLIFGEATKEDTNTLLKNY